MEVRDLKSSVAPSHTFPTVDLVDKMVYRWLTSHWNCANMNRYIASVFTRL